MTLHRNCIDTFSKLSVPGISIKIHRRSPAFHLLERFSSFRIILDCFHFDVCSTISPSRRSFLIFHRRLTLLSSKRDSFESVIRIVSNNTFALPLFASERISFARRNSRSSSIPYGVLQRLVFRSRFSYRLIQLEGKIPSSSSPADARSELWATLSRINCEILV